MAPCHDPRKPGSFPFLEKCERLKPVLKKKPRPFRSNLEMIADDVDENRIDLP